MKAFSLCQSLAFAACLILTIVPYGWADEAPNTTIKVSVDGCVKHPGMYRLQNPATIEQAFARAGGWNGKGGVASESDHIPAKECRLIQRQKGSSTKTRIPVHIDEVTGRLTVTDPKWLGYYLTKGDAVSLPEVYF